MCGNVKNDFFLQKWFFRKLATDDNFIQGFTDKEEQQGGDCANLKLFHPFQEVFSTHCHQETWRETLTVRLFIQLSWSILLWPAFPRLNWMKWYFCKKSGKCKQSWVKSRQSLSGVDSPAYSILDSQSTKRRPDFFDVKGQKLQKCTAVHIWSWRKGKRSKKMKIQDFYLQYCWNIWKRLSIILQIKKFSNSNFYHLEWIWKNPAKSSTTIDYGYYSTQKGLNNPKK